MELKHRLIAVRQHLGLSQKAMAKQVGVDEKTWQRSELGNGEPRAETLRQLIRLGFNANWIIDGLGEMLLAAMDGDDRFNEPHPAKWLSDEVAKMGYVYVPRYDVEAAAGTGALIDGEKAVRPIAFLREWLHREINANPADLVVLTARGDSMQDRIHDGDLLLVDTSEPKLRSGRQIYAFTHDGLLFVKRLEAKLDGGLIVSSDNDEVYPPQHIGRDEIASVKIIGRVLWNAGRV